MPDSLLGIPVKGICPVSYVHCFGGELLETKNQWRWLASPLIFHCLRCVEVPMYGDENKNHHGPKALFETGFT